MWCTGWGPEDGVGGSLGRRCEGTVTEIVEGVWRALRRDACLRRAISRYGASWLEAWEVMVVVMVQVNLFAGAF